MPCGQRMPRCRQRKGGLENETENRQKNDHNAAPPTVGGTALFPIFECRSTAFFLALTTPRAIALARPSMPCGQARLERDGDVNSTLDAMAPHCFPQMPRKKRHGVGSHGSLRRHILLCLHPAASSDHVCDAARCNSKQRCDTNF